MTIFDENGVPRKMYTDEQPKIVNNDQYMVQCSEPGYVPDEMYFYTCTDGVLDESTYCETKPEDFGMNVRETTIAR